MPKLLKRWEVIPATGGMLFLEKGSKRFDFYSHSNRQDLQAVADELNRQDRQIQLLKQRLKAQA
jgi:hypothetical protein